MKPVPRFVLNGTRGGPNRIRILRTLTDRPLDVDQLATVLDIDNTTVRNHLDTLEENNIITDVGDDDGAVYLPTDQADSKREFSDQPRRDG